MPIATKVEITVGCVILALCGCDDAPRHAVAQTPRAPVRAVAPASAPRNTPASPDAGTTARPTATSSVAPTSARAAEAGRAEPSRLVLWIGGDVIVPPGMIRAVRGHAGGDLAAGLESVFAPLTRFWRADAPDAHVIVNLESPVADRTRLLPNAFVHLVVPGRLVPSPLNMPRSVPEGLRRAGVHSVTLANNHALDQGRDGLAETLANVRAAGLGIIGAGQGTTEAVRPMVLGPAGARTAVISLLDRHQREPRSAAAIGIAR
ncbi:MAG: CapA family protein, partial [Deltaproteobacteria bacterium]|nr:CapA family protein [Deltaproteobacteria bacterium]